MWAGSKVAEMIDYRILGPLKVSAYGRVIEIGGPKLRALLAILLLRANESVRAMSWSTSCEASSPRPERRQP